MDVREPVFMKCSIKSWADEPVVPNVDIIDEPLPEPGELGPKAAMKICMLAGGTKVAKGGLPKGGMDVDVASGGIAKCDVAKSRSSRRQAAARIRAELGQAVKMADAVAVSSEPRKAADALKEIEMELWHGLISVEREAMRCIMRDKLQQSLRNLH